MKMLNVHRTNTRLLNAYRLGCKCCSFLPRKKEPKTISYSAATSNNSEDSCYLLRSGTNPSGKWIKATRREFIFDLTGYEGRTIQVKAYQKTDGSVVLCKYTTGLPHEPEWYNGKGSNELVTGTVSEEKEYLMPLEYCFNTNSGDTAKTSTIEKVIPTGAKFLLITQLNRTAEPSVVVMPK